MTPVNSQDEVDLLASPASLPSRRTAFDLLCELRLKGARISAIGNRVRVSAPKGLLTKGFQETLQSCKEEVLGILSQETKVLGMSLRQFARDGEPVELCVPRASQTIWFVPGEREARHLVARGIGRGRIWTAEELQRVWDMGDLPQEHAQTLARIKAQLGCELTAIGPDDGGEAS